MTTPPPPYDDESARLAAKVKGMSLCTFSTLLHLSLISPASVSVFNNVFPSLPPSLPPCAGHVTSPPRRHEQHSSNNPTAPGEHPRVATELTAQFDRGQETQAPEVRRGGREVGEGGRWAGGTAGGGETGTERGKREGELHTHMYI